MRMLPTVFLSAFLAVVARSEEEGSVPWVAVEGPMADFLKQHQRKDVLAIYTADWDLSSAVMLKLLAKPELARELDREGLVVALRNCTDMESDAAKEMTRRAADGFAIPSLVMYHRDGMLTMARVTINSEEMAKSLSGLIGKSAAGRNELRASIEKTVTIDQTMFEKATVVVRAQVSAEREGSKYHWIGVTSLKTFKAPEGVEISKSFKVAAYSFAEPLPEGESTLYLIRYNPDKPEYGWKLLQEVDETTGERMQGFSHAGSTPAVVGFTDEWESSGEGPALDESLAEKFIGKVVLIGVTYEDEDGKITGRKQWAGTIKTYSNKQGIQVDLFDSEEFCALPPDPDGISVAEPGVYRLKETGRVIRDPDYLATLVCQDPKN